MSRVKKLEVLGNSMTSPHGKDGRVGLFGKIKKKSRKIEERRIIENTKSRKYIGWSRRVDY